jgi:hypothetical protein
MLKSGAADMVLKAQRTKARVMASRNDPHLRRSSAGERMSKFKKPLRRCPKEWRRPPPVVNW